MALKPNSSKQLYTVAKATQKQPHPQKDLIEQGKPDRKTKKSKVRRRKKR